MANNKKLLMGIKMIDEQTRRSVETMCLCGLDVDGLKGCFLKIEENVLKEIYENTKINGNDSSEELHVGISCNCS